MYRPARGSRGRSSSHPKEFHPAKGIRGHYSSRSGRVGAALDEHGDIYVAARGNDRVVLFDRNGRYVERFLGDATISKSGRVYLMANAKVLRLRDMSTLEAGKRFRAPAAVRIDSDRLFVADFGFHRVQVYRKEAYPLRAADVMAHPGAPKLETV